MLPPRRRRRLALAVCVALVCVASAARAGSTRIVLVTVDTLRKDAFETAMPRTRAFAERGQVFERFYSATSSTQPSHASLFTGLHPWQHGVSRNGQVLPDAHTTLAELLAAAGFETRAVVASFPMHAVFGWSRGFQVFEDEFGRAHPAVPGDWGGELLEDGFYRLGGSVTQRALALLDSASAPRQFFWFHYFDPHGPYGDAGRRADAPVLSLAELQAELAKRPGDPRRSADRARRLYDRDVAILDKALDRLWRRLDSEPGVETHVIFVSDHGESFGEDGSLGHGTRLTAEQVHVPFFVVSPRLAPGRRRDLAGSVDLPATVLGLAGVASPLPGRDLGRPAAADAGSAFGMRRSYAEPLREVLTDGSVAIRFAPDFYTVQGGAILAGDARRVRRDDLRDAALGDEQAAPFRALFGTFAAELSGQAPVELTDPETREALRALGYAR